jgi:hypothetical protein
MNVLYTTRVDKGVEYDPETFAQEIDIYLTDPDGWTAYGYRFVRSNRPQVIIHLATPETIKESGCPRPDLSCAQLRGRHMRLNVMRWMNGSKASKLPLDAYRQYVVSHEMGHILGYEHVVCPGPGRRAPIMMQQTLGIGTCTPNTKLTDKDVSE